LGSLLGVGCARYDPGEEKSGKPVSAPAEIRLLTLMLSLYRTPDYGCKFTLNLSEKRDSDCTKPKLDVSWVRR